MRVLWQLCCATMLALPVQALAGDTALVMSVQGTVERIARPKAIPLEPFVKLEQTDQLVLAKGARLQIVYFDSGRQEIWSGSGKLEIGATESRSMELAAAEVKQLPLIVVKQLARTPALDSQGRAGVARLRSIPTSETLHKVQENYAALKAQAPRGDLSPEMYRLSGFFEVRDLDKVEQVLAEIKAAYPDNPEAALLSSLYKKAVIQARRTGGQGGQQ